MNVASIELELVNRIACAAQAYYEGHPIMSDMEFDALINNLRVANPENPILQKTGWGYVPVGDVKVPHKVHIGSLSKLRLEEIDMGILQKFFIATPKIDGGGVVCYYENGILDRIVSRGDGDIGIDITSNMMHAVPITIENPIAKYMGIRGEGTIAVEDFERIGGSHPRNLAVGMMQTKNWTPNTHLLRFVAYAIVWISEDLTIGLNKMFQLQLLREWGFEFVSMKHVHSPNQLETIPKDLVVTRDNKTIPVDGIVISADDADMLSLQHGLSIVNPSMAIKYAEESKNTRVISIEWKATRTGRIVPVANIAPVHLSGATISRVTCYNYAFIVENRIGTNAIVTVVRANEVIPKIICTVDGASSMNANIPDKCPTCGSRLYLNETGLDLVCPNLQCSIKLDNVLYRLFEITKPDGIGEITLDKLVFHIKNWIDNDYSVEDLLSAIGNILKHISSNPNNALNEFQLEYGDHTGYLIFEMFGNIANFVPKISDIVYIASIPTVGDVTCETLNAIDPEKFKILLASRVLESVSHLFRTSISWINFSSNLNRVSAILTLFGGRLKSGIIALGTVRVAVTGKLSTTRDQWYKDHSKLLFDSSVTRDTRYLVCNESSDTSKHKAARELSVPIITEEEFEKIYANL